jgi:hypothetical protein
MLKKALVALTVGFVVGLGSGLLMGLTIYQAIFAAFAGDAIFAVILLALAVVL